MCPFCNAAMEDVQHVFFRCDVARVVLRKICRWWDLDWQEICSFSDWDAWFLSFRLSSRLKSILEGVFYVAWWRIWRLRNQLVFDASPPNRSTIFDDINTWKTFNIDDVNGLIRLKKKLQLLKIAIKAWMKVAKMKSNDKKFNIQQNLLELDKLIDQGKSNEEILCKDLFLLMTSMRLTPSTLASFIKKQKSVYHERYKNSKYFHGIINKKKIQLAIWVSFEGDRDFEIAVQTVKNEFLCHFQKQFSPPQQSRIYFDYIFLTRLSSDLVEDLERDVSYDEVKAAVWDSNKYGLLISVIQRYTLKLRIRSKRCTGVSGVSKCMARAEVKAALLRVSILQRIKQGDPLSLFSHSDGFRNLHFRLIMRNRTAGTL
ncbi:hypothetical protein Tco_0846585 [Tanacetum coccineum]